MTNIISQIRALLAKDGKLITVAFTYAYHLAIAWLVSWGLRHGFHLSTGYLGISFLTFFGRLGLAELAHAYGVGHTRGTLAAYIEHAASQTVDEHFHDAAEAIGQEQAEKAASKPAGAYL